MDSMSLILVVPFKFISMLLDVIKLLDKSKPGVLENIAKENLTFHGVKNSKHPHLSGRKSDLRVPIEIKEGVYLETNFSSVSIMNFIDTLMDQFNVDKSLFSVSVVAEEPTDDEDD